MTPIAADIARQCLEAGQRADFDEWCQYQWFECTGIGDLAYHAHQSDESPVFPGDLNWPAPDFWVEFEASVIVPSLGGRLGICIATSAPGTSRRPYFGVFAKAARWTRATRLYAGYFECGTEWGTVEDPTRGVEAFTYLNIALHCVRIINTPRMVLTRERSSKLLRAQGISGMFPVASWTQVRMDPAATITPKLADPRGPAMPFHYVRGHKKPSLGGRWIEGYWRGSIELGVHLHTYEAVQ
jgi:hypothetical protein